MDSGARIDTYNDDEDEYGSDDDGYARRPGFGDLADEDRLSVNLDDIQDEESDEDTIDLTKKAEGNANGGLGAVPGDNEESKDAVNTSGSDEHNKSTGGSSGSGGQASTGNLFAVGESQDKGLADIETGSEVYMSELLVSDKNIFYFALKANLHFSVCRLDSTWKTSTRQKR